MVVPSPTSAKADRSPGGSGDPRSSPPPSSHRPEQDSSSESSTTSTASGDLPERRDIDILAQVLFTRSEEYRLLFRLPHGEVLVQDFNCALQENILLQGHMYLFIHHICFYSNIFGFETKRTISYYEVTCVQKAKTAAIFPNAIEITAGDKKHFFGSFLSRDEAYKLIVDAWQQHGMDAKVISDSPDSKYEGNGSENAAVILGRECDIRTIVDCTHFGGSVVINDSEIHENADMNGCTSYEAGQSWQPEDVDAPEVPGYFTLVAKGKFPVHSEDFFKLFFSDDATDFLEKFHADCGDKDFQCGRWQRNADFVHARDLSFRHPIKIYFGSKFGHCHAIQKFRIYRNSHLVIDVSQQVSDVPYGDYFHVQVLWDVEMDSKGGSCLLQVYINVAFSRKTMWKGKIEQNTIDECREVYGNWISSAHKLLKEKNLEEYEESCICVGKIEPGNGTKLESSLGLEDLRNVPVIVPHMTPLEMQQNVNHLNVRDHVESLDFSGSFANSLKGSWTNLSSYIRSQHYSFIAVIMTLFIIAMLMQIIIIILLWRAPNVCVISQESFMNGLTHERSEVDWLEKRVYLLAEEMGMMEIRLERLRQEYSFLKGHLHDLQLVKHK